ncbi:MAG: Rpn family recombination-promoting nuclease/putative transposase, partial [Bacteroidetes bacterium]
IQSQAKKNSKKNNFVWNYELQKVYSVAVLDFTFDENSEIKKVKHDIVLKDSEDNTIFYDKLQFIFLEMPHFTKNIKDLKNHYEKWLYLLKNLPKLDKIPQEFKEKIFMKVFEKSDTSFYSDEELSAYQSSLKTYTDYQNTIDTAFMEGEMKGEIKGEMKNKENVTINALKKGFDYETIQDLTGLSFEEIEKIKNKYNL